MYAIYLCCFLKDLEGVVVITVESGKLIVNYHMCTHCYSGNIIDPPKVRTHSHQTPALKRRHSNLYLQVDINMSKSCTCMCMSGCVSTLIYLCAIASMSVCGRCK